MKRLVLIIGALLLGFALKAQEATYACRYWFDQNHAQAVTTTFGKNGWEAELDVGNLTDGLHTLHLQVLAADTVSVLNIASDSLYHTMDTTIMKWSAPQSYLFLKVNATPAANLEFRYWFDQDHATMQSGTLGNGQLLFNVADLDAGLHALHVILKDSEYSSSQTYLFLKTDTWEQGTPNYVYHCWFDEDFANQQTDALGSGHLLLNVLGLEDGMHTVHVLVEGSTLTSTQSYLFMKVAPFAADSVDMSHLAHRCWFDEDFEHQQIDSLGNGHFLLDVSELEDGLHTVHVMLEGSTLTATQSYMFMKIPVEDPSFDLQYVCWFDQDYGTVQTGPVGTGIFELEVGDLSNGLHTVNVQLDKGTRSAPQCYLFYKQPLGGYGVARWEYWLNDDFDNRQKTNLSPTVDTLDIISLLNVGHPALRSSCFHFHPNGDEPYINAKNQISFRFWDSENRFFDKSAFYVDEQVQQDIVASVFERNTTKTFAAPRNNQIQWYKLDAVVGDSLSFVASKACTMQLFAPSGEEVFSVLGPESVALRGLHAWEDGTYYLAVHDMTGSGETLQVTYNWVYRYAILAYDVHLVGNGGCSTITFNGNGYNSLLDVYLVNAQNDTIHRLDIGHESNSATTVTFNFFGVNLGVYDAVFRFNDETMRINGALEVEQPTPILLTNSVSYPHAFLSGHPVTYSYTITNHGNMSAYGIPIFVYISTLGSGNVTQVKLDGLRLPSLIDAISTDSLTEKEISELKEFSDNMSDLHHFFVFKVYDENVGDSINVLSNYFYLNIAPLEQKKLDIVVTATTGTHRPLNVWMTVPNDTVQPLILFERGARNQYCCVKDKMECVLNITADISGLISKIPGAWGVAGKITECVTSSLSTLSSTIGYWVCREEGDPLPFDYESMGANTNSALSLITACFKKFPEAFKQLKALLEGKGFAGLRDLCGITQDINDCVTAFTKRIPGCPPGDGKGGSSDGQTPGDPNDIHGYLSESGSHYMRQEIQNVQYEIEFENDTALATAAAHTIIVRDTLDATKFDLNSLAARSVTIGDKRMELNGEQTFAKTLDLRPEIYVIAQVEQNYDPSTGIIQWTIQSLDPMTMEPTDDPNQGVLPVNYFGNGIGFIDYSVNLKEIFADGTAISNRAGIVFDQEDVIMTPTWTNIVDAVNPTSYIEEVTVDADTLNFSFTSEDNRSGVWYHTLYHRNASTEMEWKVKKAQIFENNYLLVNDELMTTEFLVMATDSAGNHEEKEMLAEYIFVYDGPGQITQADALAQGWNWWSTYIEQDSQDGLVELENSLGHNGLTIKSQNDFTDNFYQDMGIDYWYGSLESIQNEQGYLINVAQPCNTSLTGIAANSTNHPITIHPNWNWIGYPVASPQVVTSALAGFNPSPDDVVKGQSDFTSYFEGYGWYPEDFLLVPGQSYLYCSNATINKTLTYAGSSRGGAVKLTKAGKRYWNNNVHAFADNFNVIAVVKVDNVEQRGENLELGAFVNGECRGSVRLRRFAPLDRYYAMLTIAGQEDDKVEFRLIDTENFDKEETGTNQLVFKKNAVVGRLGKPYEICFGYNDVVTVNIAMYPNPVKKGHVFSLEIPHDEIITEITITDALGNQLRRETGAVNVKSIKGLPVAGVYVIKAVAKSGTTYHGRLIVE
ncbi:MAG: T9SS type A sorting domain-containing protein [Bacteroidales bacterium]|nr:T9SS type A sorting domain-containing protein [Bacteroidales bacterium]